MEPKFDLIQIAQQLEVLARRLEIYNEMLAEDVHQVAGEIYWAVEGGSKN